MLPSAPARGDAAARAAAEWLVRRSEGLAADEEAAFQGWLADPAHADAYAQMERLWAGLDVVPERYRTVAPPGTAAAPAPAPAWPRRRVLAGGFCLLALGAGWAGLLAWQAAAHPWRHYATARGEQSTQELPDGTRLWLDTGTRLAVRYEAGRRDVRLVQGQAFFDVRRIDGAPFDVRAGSLRVRVTGTRFSVRATDTGLNAGGVGVAVEEGSVAVSDRPVRWLPARWRVDLSAGQSLDADGDGRAGPVGRNEAGLWRSGRIAFRATPLSQAVAEFERYGDTGLRIDDPAVAQLRLSGSFELGRLDAFLRVLPRVLPVRLEAAGSATRIARAAAG